MFLFVLFTYYQCCYLLVLKLLIAIFFFLVCDVTLNFEDTRPSFPRWGLIVSFYFQILYFLTPFYSVEKSRHGMEIIFLFHNDSIFFTFHLATKFPGVKFECNGACRGFDLWTTRFTYDPRTSNPWSIWKWLLCVILLPFSLETYRMFKCIGKDFLFYL